MYRHYQPTMKSAFCHAQRSQPLWRSSRTSPIGSCLPSSGNVNFQCQKVILSMSNYQPFVRTWVYDAVLCLGFANGFSSLSLFHHTLHHNKVFQCLGQHRTATGSVTAYVVFVTRSISTDISAKNSSIPFLLDPGAASSVAESALSTDSLSMV